MVLQEGTPIHAVKLRLRRVTLFRVDAGTSHLSSEGSERERIQKSCLKSLPFQRNYKAKMPVIATQTRLVLVLALLYTSVPLNLGLAHPAPSDVPDASLVALLANPKEYGGKYVRVTGYLQYKDDEAWSSI